jgi:hypothetical protein
VKRVGDDVALNVPIDESLRDRVKAEARANGMQLREAVRDALVMWLHTSAYLREQQAGRAEERANRRQN